MRHWTLLIALPVVFFVGCQKKDDDSTDPEKVQDPPNVASSVEEDGVVTSKIVAGTGAVTLAASKSSPVKGAGVSIPTGALAVDTEIVLQEGSSLSAMLEDLEISRVTSQELGPALAVTASTGAVVAGQLSISVPYVDSTASSLQEESIIGVLYLLDGAQGVVGIATGSEVTLADGKATISAKGFGSFQVVRIPVGTAPQSKPTVEKVVPKRDPAGSLAGNWLKPCATIAEVNGEETEIFSERSYLITGPTRYYYRMQRFNSTDCSKVLMFEVEASAKPTVGDLIAGSTETRELNLLMETFVVTPRSEYVVTHFNNISFCGKSGFVLDVGMDMTGGKCDSGSLPGETQYSTARFQKDVNIFLGTDSDGKDGRSAAARFTKLELFPYFRVPRPSFD